ncbi:hypothetical protein BAE44_0007380 [Dichanthelium oligosanthes]|uniref:S1 motif domain-containing protein n=1 Tax=Dichanthelium oligosanthes TaxID=888268 RepID=A0A1E5W2U6_9POAL|nr:hypothetical protein BAE44_0007380 [Dichanthelium oligosanthes]
MLTASLKPAPSLAAFPASARRSPAASVSFPFHARLNRRPLLSAAATAEGTGAPATQGDVSSSSTAAAAPPIDEARLAQFAADWEAARADKDQGKVLTLPVLRANSGGLIVKFNSLQGFVPNPLLSPAHWCKVKLADPKRPIQDVTKDLVGTSISVKVIKFSLVVPLHRLFAVVSEVNEEERKLVFSEKDASWSKYSSQIKIGDIYDGIVGSVFHYGAFVHLRFPDGLYHLTGLVHISEVSWDLVQDVQDFLNDGDAVKGEVKDSFINQTTGGRSSIGDIGQSYSFGYITDVQFGRQALEKRVVSQDLELWLSNVPAKDNKFTLLARAGRQSQIDRSRGIMIPSYYLAGPGSVFDNFPRSGGHKEGCAKSTRACSLSLTHSEQKQSVLVLSPNFLTEAI